MKTKKTKVSKRKAPLIEVVDDHIQTAISVSQILEHAGYRTIQTYSAVDALEMCKREHPDLLILDIRLDQYSGYDVASKLPNQKILFMTGFEVNETRANEFKNSVGIMKKPIDMEVLLKFVKKAVGKA